MLSDSWAGFHEFAITHERPGLTLWDNVIHFCDIRDSTSETVARSSDWSAGV